MHYRLARPQSKSQRMLLACLAQCFQEESEFAEDNQRLRAESIPVAARKIFAP